MIGRDGRHPELSLPPLVSIVDDDPSVRRSTRRLLRCSALRAETFVSADEFLQSRYLAQTACLLLDVRMPGMSGLELQRRLAASGCRVPIVFLSAGASEDEKRRALRGGATDFLGKPVSEDALFRAIRAALDVPSQ